MIKRFMILICILALTGCVARSGPKTTVFVPPVFSVKPELIIIDTIPDVYYVRGHVNIFFYSGSWYYYSDNAWYMSSSYNGPWGVIETHRLPARFGQIPPGHLRTPPGQAKPKPEHHKDKDADNRPPGHRKKDK